MLHENLARLNNQNFMYKKIIAAIVLGIFVSLPFYTFAGPHRPVAYFLCDKLKNDYFVDHAEIYKEDPDIDLFNIRFSELVDVYSYYYNFDSKNNYLGKDYDVNNNNYELVSFGSREDDYYYYLISLSNKQQIENRMNTLLHKCSYDLDFEERSLILERLNQWVDWNVETKYNYGRQNSFFILPKSDNNISSVNNGYTSHDQTYRFEIEIVDDLIVVYPERMKESITYNKLWTIFSFGFATLIVVYLVSQYQRSKNS